MSSLVINTNASAISAFNSLNATDAQETKAINELSSGLQIQTAADGPAAYITSQALQSQASGYETAITNTQSGVSLIQTASGALNQISDILQTMNQLALSSANGATQDSTSLAANQAEFAALQSDINQIAETTSYGTTNLLDGSFSNQALQVGAFDLTNQQISISISSATAASLGVAASSSEETPGTWTSSTPVTTGTGSAVVFDLTVDGNDFVIPATDSSGDNPAQLLSGIQEGLTDGGAASSVTASLNASDELVFTSTSDGPSSTVSVSNVDVAGSDDWGLGSGISTTGSGSPGVSIATVADAQLAASAVQSAITQVDSIEANIGAVQNQLQSVAANLTVGQQNLTAATSQLVDVNMAQEMTRFSTDQILMQTGTAMLSQAQQSPNLVLKLLGS